MKEEDVPTFKQVYWMTIYVVCSLGLIDLVREIMRGVLDAATGK